MPNAFKTSLLTDSLADYIANQINNFFPDKHLVSKNDLVPTVKIALERTFKCFSEIDQKYYADGNSVLFNHLNSDHYSIFLYLLSNSLYLKGLDAHKRQVADKIFLLNKALHGIDAYYSIKLPEVFLFVHPIGTVLGNAEYGNYFAVYQNCTVGSGAVGSDYPAFGDYVVLFSGSSVIGNCNVGSNVVFGAQTHINNTDVQSNTVVTGRYPSNQIRENKEHVLNRRFRS